ncbi:SAV_915 family protein [Streptomyces sp. NPDC015242]|uniref:SAV_915 family protein n=1 Tax=Streptomyces sp. NPDC015242 TaxID=3364951 RepID=UPI0036FE62EB
MGLGWLIAIVPLLPTGHDLRGQVGGGLRDPAPGTRLRQTNPRSAVRRPWARTGPAAGSVEILARRDATRRDGRPCLDIGVDGAEHPPRRQAVKATGSGVSVRQRHAAAGRAGPDVVAEPRFASPRPGPANTPLGVRTAAGFTSERRLTDTLGPHRQWIRLPAPALRALTAPLGITTVTVDPLLLAPAPTPVATPAPAHTVALQTT